MKDKEHHHADIWILLVFAIALAIVNIFGCIAQIDRVDTLKEELYTQKRQHDDLWISSTEQFFAFTEHYFEHSQAIAAREAWDALRASKEEEN